MTHRRATRAGGADVGHAGPGDIVRTHAVAEGARATGAAATGTLATGAMALGAFAIGALAVGALAIGRLAVGQARFKRVDIGHLTVGQLDIGPTEEQADAVTYIARVRAAAGRGDDLATLLLDEVWLLTSGTPGLRLDAPQRSTADPDLFLLRGESGDEAAFERHARPRLEALLRRIAEAGLSPDDAAGLELYRSLP